MTRRLSAPKNLAAPLSRPRSTRTRRAFRPVRGGPSRGTLAAKRARALLNWANLTTPLGLLLARAAGCRIVPAPDGLFHATGYTPRLPVAGAFTVGNVILFRPRFRDPGRHPLLLAHEARHCTQYAVCLGLPFLPLYAAAALWSWLRTGDPASRNPFERAAGLRDGGYVERPVRPALGVLRLLRASPRPSLPPPPPPASAGQRRPARGSR